MSLLVRGVVPFALAAAVAAQVPQFVAAPLPPNIGAYSGRACLGDHDGDGDLDLYIEQLSVAPGMPALFANDGAGNFTHAANVLPPHLSWSLTPAFVDFDGDGDLDLYLSYPGAALLFRNPGGGAPWSDASNLLPPAPVFARGLVVADLDGDGDRDLVGTGMTIQGGRNHVLVNGGAAGFTRVEPFPGNGTTLVVFDADGDLDLDVLVGGGAPRLWRNDGALQFTDVTATRLPALASVGALAAGDLDGDGDVDVAAGGAPSNNDVLLRNNGQGAFTFGAALPSAIASTELLLRDFDGDGDLDLLRGASFASSLLRNNGAGAFTLATGAVPPALLSYALVAGDLDRDGDEDLIGVGFGVGASTWRNRHRHVDSTAPPVHGQTWNVRVASQPGYAVAARPVVLGIGLARLPQPWVLPGLGASWLDFAAPVLLTNGAIAATADATTFAFVLPPIPALVGIRLHAQALIDEGPAGPRLTNRLSVAIQ